MHFAEIHACNSIIIRCKKVLLFLTNLIISLEITSVLFVVKLIRSTFPNRKQTGKSEEYVNYML